nr:antibiotic biosynthesis monooxygenase [Desulfobulbaceae bacterium]
MDIIRTIMKVSPEKQKEVLQTLISLIEPLGKKNGCLSYGIYCDIEDKNIFNLISEWDNRQHLDDYMMSGRFSVLLGIKSLLCKPIEITILTVLNCEGIEAVNDVRKKIKLIYPVLIPVLMKIQKPIEC